MERVVIARELRNTIKKFRGQVKTNLGPLFDFWASAKADIWAAWKKDFQELTRQRDKPKQKAVQKAVKRRRDKTTDCCESKRRKHILLSPSL